MGQHETRKVLACANQRKT